jgi:hypothetical protein
VQNRDNLIWIDLEMTGLKPEVDTIIEIATVVTDAQLRVLAEGPVFAIHASEEVLAGMDEWNTRQHTASGLIARVRESRVTLAVCAAGRAPPPPPPRWSSCGGGCRAASRRCAATASARTGASSRG